MTSMRRLIDILFFILFFILAIFEMSYERLIFFIYDVFKTSFFRFDIYL